jgi:hypothetical protein
VVVPVGDPAALAAAVVERIVGRTPSAQPEAAATVRRYDWSVVGAEIIAVYDRVLDADDRPAGSTTPPQFELSGRSESR